MSSRSWIMTPMTRSLSIRESLGDAAHFLKEGMEIEVSFYKGKQVGIELPNMVILEIIETEPGFKARHCPEHNKAGQGRNWLRR